MEVDAHLVAAERRGLIGDVLLGVVAVDAAGLSRVKWEASVHRIEVMAELAGGRSGAAVLELTLFTGEPKLPRRLVAKIGPRSEISREWLAYRAAVAERSNTIFTPVVALSETVLIVEPDMAEEDEPAAIVYQHVADYAGAAAGDPTRTVQDLVAAALDGKVPVLHAVATLESLFARLRETLYKPATTVSLRTLRHLNIRLGPDVIVEVDRRVGPERLHYGAPTSAQMRQLTRHTDDLIDAATHLDLDHLPEDRRIQPGELIRLTGLRVVETAADRLRAIVGHATVEVRIADGPEPGLDLRTVSTHDASSLTVVGRVVCTRAAAQMSLLRKRLPELRVEGPAVDLEGVRVSNPFNAVFGVLTEQIDGRRYAVAHGDLNPGNVLLAAGQVFLVDYSHVGSAPLGSDAAWMEACLLRNVLADRLGWSSLVRVQRRLAQGCMTATAPDLVLARPSAGSSVEASATAILWAVRRGVKRCFAGDDDAPEWGREYLRQLTLSALTALKWSDTTSDTASALAVLATAGVAAEWLGGEEPYRYWLDNEFVEEARSVLPILSPAHSSVMLSVAPIVREVDRRRPRLRLDDLVEIEVEIDRIRTEIATTFANEAHERLYRLQLDHNVFISLRAFIRLDARRSSSFRGDEVDGDAITLITEEDEVVVLGGAGAGKTTVVRELEYRLARAVSDAAGAPASEDPVAPGVAPGVTPRLPVVLKATEVLDWHADQNLMAVGAIHLIVDAFNELGLGEDSRAAREAVAERIRRWRTSFPRTPIVVCHRTLGFDQELLPFPTVTLHQVTDVQSREYIAKKLQESKVPDHAERAEALIRLLFNSDDHRTVRDLAQTPLFLWMLTERFTDPDRRPPTRLGALFRDFTTWYLEDRHHSREGVAAPIRNTAEKIRLLEALAYGMVELGGQTDVSEAEVPQLVADARLDDVDTLLAEVVDAELLEHQGTTLRFLHQSFQEYFAARLLLRHVARPEVLYDRALQVRWREPLRLMLTFPEEDERSHNGDDQALALINLALRADPNYAAELLRACEHPPPVAAKRFLAAQEATLRQVDSGERAWREAADALAQQPTSACRPLLHSLINDTSVPVGARRAALTSLTHVVGLATSKDGRTVLLAELTATVRTLLDAAAPLELWIDAVHLVGTAGLSSLTTYVAELVNPLVPWPVCRAAVTTLERLDNSIPAVTTHRYVEACVQRLPRAEEELRTSSQSSAITRLQTERLLILDVLAEAGHLDLVLARRFDYEIAEDYSWPRRLAHQARLPGLSKDARAAIEILSNEHDAETLLASYRSTADDLIVNAAAHRILTEHSTRAHDLLSGLSAASSRSRLLVAAEAARQLAVGDQLEALAFDIFSPRSSDMEPLASLVSALPPGYDKTFKLSKCMFTLVKGHHSTAHCWPFVRLWMSHNFTSNAKSQLLDADLRMGIWLLARTMAWLRHGRPGPPVVVVDAEVARQLLAAAPGADESPGAKSDFALACVATGHTSAFDHVKRWLGAPMELDLVSPSTDDSYGTREVSQLGWILLAFAYLALPTERRDRDTDRALEAHRLLSVLDTRLLHPHVEQSRLIALSILGDWEPLLRALPQGAPWLHTAAHNAINEWLDGPCTPSAQRRPEDVARWIARRLTDDGISLPPDARSTLADIKEDIERRLGRYVLAD